MSNEGYRCCSPEDDRGSIAEAFVPVTPRSFGKVVDGMTKQEVHDELVRIIELAATRSVDFRNSMFIAPGQTVDPLAHGEADRIVRNLAASDSAYEWGCVRRGIAELSSVIRIYRRMEWS